MSFKLPPGVRLYFERAPLAALFLGVSSGFTFAMIGASRVVSVAPIIANAKPEEMPRNKAASGAASR